MLLLFFLGLPVWIQEVHLALVLGSSQWWSFAPDSKPMVTERSGREADGVSWKVSLFGSGSGGKNTDLTLADAEGHRFEWRANSETDFPEVLICTENGRTRFLCYQLFWTSSNYGFLEKPMQFDYGIWVIERGDSGFKKVPIVSNLIGLLAREPLFTAAIPIKVLMGLL